MRMLCGCGHSSTDHVNEVGACQYCRGGEHYDVCDQFAIRVPEPSATECDHLTTSITLVDGDRPTCDTCGTEFRPYEYNALLMKRRLHDPGHIQVAESTGAVKDDGTKVGGYHLIPPGPWADLAALYEFGARKYTPRNWERGFAWSRPYNALIRHLEAFRRGEVMDDGPGGSGLPHMTAVTWNAVALAEFTNTHPELNDLWPGHTVPRDEQQT